MRQVSDPIESFHFAEFDVHRNRVLIEVHAAAVFAERYTDGKVVVLKPLVAFYALLHRKLPLAFR